MGHVDTYAQTGVSNQITIKPRVDAGVIKDEIMIALNRSWLCPEKTDVTARDGKVTLTGTVDYWDVRAFAGTTAWAAPRCHLGDARYPRLLKIRKPQQIRCRRALRARSRRVVRIAPGIIGPMNALCGPRVSKKLTDDTYFSDPAPPSVTQGLIWSCKIGLTGQRSSAAR